MGESQVFDQEEATYIDTASGTQVTVEEPEDRSRTDQDHDQDRDEDQDHVQDHDHDQDRDQDQDQDQDTYPRGEDGAHSPGLESTTTADPIGPDLGTPGQDHPGARRQEQTTRDWDDHHDDVPDDATAAGFPAPTHEEHPDTAPLQQPAPVADSPYGPGSALPDEDGRGPWGWQVKGTVGSMLFHTPDSPSYSSSRAEVWFADEQTARAAGFAHWDRKQR